MKNQSLYNFGIISCFFTLDRADRRVVLPSQGFQRLTLFFW